ncbi:MAG: hypothetical protein V3T70_03145 [Phycisphaerae bacterium]
MNEQHDTDRQFNDNLRNLAHRADTPGGPTDGLRSRCDALLRGQTPATAPRPRQLWRRPALISTVGLAAMIALAVGFFVTPREQSDVNAAMILTALQTQVRETSLLDITLKSIAMDGVQVNGRLQVARDGVAGDLQARIQEGGEDEVIEVDLALGITPDAGWVFLRRLALPDPKVMALLRVFMLDQGNVLLKLPTEELDLDLAHVFTELNGESVIEFVHELIDSASEVGATVEEQSDGTLIVSMPIDGVGAKDAISRLRMFGEAGVTSDDEPDRGASRLRRSRAAGRDSDDESPELGGTLVIHFDPAAQQVRSLRVEDFVQESGVISLVLRSGSIDPALLDADRLIDENTRVFDLDAIQKMFHAFERE